MRGLGLGLGLFRDAALAPPANVVDWYTRVVANGGVLTQSQLNRVSALTAAYDAAGLTDATCRFNPYCGNNLAAALVPVFRGGGPNTDTNVNFAAGDFGPAAGLTGDGATKYLNTGVAPNALGFQASWHHGVYNLSDTSVDFWCEMGSSPSLTNRTSLFVRHTNTDTASDCWNVTSRSAFVSLSPLRLILGNRAASDNHTMNINGVQVADATGSAGTTRPAEMVFVHARSVLGLMDSPSPRPLGGYTFGRRIPTADIPALSAAWSTYSLAMGRPV